MKISKAIIGILAAVALSSCNVQKRIVYIQDAKDKDIVTMAESGQIRIKPLDKLKIIVSCKDPELAARFEKTDLPQFWLYMDMTGYSTSDPQPYSVYYCADGGIDLNALTQSDP